MLSVLITAWHQISWRRLNCLCHGNTFFEIISFSCAIFVVVVYSFSSLLVSFRTNSSVLFFNPPFVGIFFMSSVHHTMHIKIDESIQFFEWGREWKKTKKREWEDPAPHSNKQPKSNPKLYHASLVYLCWWVETKMKRRAKKNQLEITRKNNYSS